MKSYKILLVALVFLVGCTTKQNNTVPEHMATISSANTNEAEVTDDTNVIYTINNVVKDENYDVPNKESFTVDMTVENKSDSEQSIVTPDLWKHDHSGQIGDMKTIENNLDRKMLVDEKVEHILITYEVPEGENQFILKVGNISADVPIKLVTIVVVDQELNSNTGSQSVEFETTEQYPNYSISIENNSDVEYVCVTDGSDDMSFTISPLLSNISDGWFETPSTKTLSVTSSDGSKLEGHITVKIY